MMKCARNKQEFLTMHTIYVVNTQRHWPRNARVQRQIVHLLQAQTAICLSVCAVSRLSGNEELGASS